MSSGPWGEESGKGLANAIRLRRFGRWDNVPLLAAEEDAEAALSPHSDLWR